MPHEMHMDGSAVCSRCGQRVLTADDGTIRTHARYAQLGPGSRKCSGGGLPPASLDLYNGSTRMAREVRAAFGARND